MEFKVFMNKKIKLMRKVNERDFFHQGILKEENEMFILMDDEKKGLLYLPKIAIRSIELAGDWK